MIAKCILLIVSFFSAVNVIGMQSFNSLSLTSNYSRHHDTLVLSDHSSRSSARDGFGINISFDNSRRGSYRSADTHLKRCYGQLQDNPHLLDAFDFLKIQSRTDIQRVVDVFDKMIYQTDNNCALKVAENLLRLREVMPHDVALQKHFHAALESLKPVICHSNGTLKDSLTSSEIQQIQKIVYTFNEASKNWYEDTGLLDMAEQALRGSVYVPRTAYSGSAAAALLPVPYDISYIPSTKFDAIFKDVLRANNFDAINLCKTFCKEEIAGISPALFLEKINSAEYSKDRALLLELGKMGIHCAQDRVQLERYIRYAQQGCSSLEYASDCRAYACALATERLAQGSPILSAMNDYSIPAPAKFQDIIRQKILAVFAEHIPALEDPAQRVRISALFSKIDTAYGKMIKGDWQAQLLLEKAIVPRLCPEAFDIDLNKIVEPQHRENQQLFSACLDEIVQAQHQMKEEGVQYTTIQYRHDFRTAMYMIKDRRLNFREYLGSIEGNQLDHALHRVTLANFKVSAELQDKGIAASRKELFEVANKSNEMVRSYVKSRDYSTAMSLSTFANRALTYIKESAAFKIGSEATIGSVKGIAKGIGNVIHKIEYPWECLGQLTISIGELGNLCLKGFDKILIEVPPREVPAVIYQSIKDTILKMRAHLSKLSIEERFEKGSEFVTETFIVSQILPVATSFINEEAALLMQEASAVQKAESVAAATAEGVEIKVATQAAESTAISESQAILEKATQIECPASCINQYEKLKNALRIKEFTSIIKCTEHGLQRLIERGFSPDDVRVLLNSPDFIRIQADSAKAFIKIVGDNKFNILVYNKEKEVVITAIKNMCKEDLISLGERYGWRL